MMKITILDGYTVHNEDLSWDALKKLGELNIFDNSTQEQALERIGDSDIVMQNKIRITEDILKNSPNLKLVCELATGYDNVDVKAAGKLGIGVCNIPAYSTDAVAQHTIALLLEICSSVGLHDESVHKGEWSRAGDFCYWKKPIVLLKGRSLGIIGYGNIGKRVAVIAEALGMKVNIYSRDPEAAIRSDYISLHCPCTDENRGFINKEFIEKMLPGACIINTARGALINENDVAEALKSGRLSAFAADVLNGEPPEEVDPLLSAPNCILTPHLAWSPAEMRQTIIDVSMANIESFLSGGRLNRVD